MVGAVSNFLQGNPVYDYDDNDYIGVYVQDEWRLRPNLTINVGVRWEPYLPIKNTLDYVSNFDHRGSTPACAARSIRRRRAGLHVPGR